MAKINFEADCPCIVCGTFGDGLVCLHHILTRKAHPEFKYSNFNLMPLCFSCHAKAHSMSLYDFSLKYRNVEFWLLMNHWEWDDFYKKWNRPSSDDYSSESSSFD